MDWEIVRNWAVLVISILSIIINIILGVTVVFLKSRLARENEKASIIEGNLTSKKYEAYTNLADMMYSAFAKALDQRDGKKRKIKNDSDELFPNETLMKVKSTLLMYGSDDVFRKFVRMLSDAAGEPPLVVFNMYAELMVAIRKDLRIDKTDLNNIDVALSITHDHEEVSKLYPYYRKSVN